MEIIRIDPQQCVYVRCFSCGLEFEIGLEPGRFEDQVAPAEISFCPGCGKETIQERYVELFRCFSEEGCHYCNGGARLSENENASPPGCNHCGILEGSESCGN